jgi:hypothetical protein
VGFRPGSLDFEQCHEFFLTSSLVTKLLHEALIQSHLLFSLRLSLLVQRYQLRICLLAL